MRNIFIESDPYLWFTVYHRKKEARGAHDQIVFAYRKSWIVGIKFECIGGRNL